MAVNVYGGEHLLDKETAAKMASVVAMLLWVGLFYWLRLFESFSMYIYLILKTLSDVKAFMVLYFIILLCFTNGLFILDLKQEEYEFVWEDYPDIPNL